MAGLNIYMLGGVERERKERERERRTPRISQD